MTRIDQQALVVVTGMSGAGRSTALHALEDLGFYCIDNLPPVMLAQAVATCVDSGAHTRLGIGIDVRLRAFLGGADEEIDRLRAQGAPLIVLFLDAEDAVLVRRFSETRRPHPLHRDADVGLLSSQASGRAVGIERMILAERERLLDLRTRADRVIDTTRLTPHALRSTLVEMFSGSGMVRMTVRVLSFGFKHGVPIDADLMFDVRHLPNPHFVPDLRPGTGLDEPVARYVFDHAESREMLTSMEQFLRPLLPRYASEGKSVLTIAIGCTGGRHRSVALVEALSRSLSSHEVAGRPLFDVVVSHRDLQRGG